MSYCTRGCTVWVVEYGDACGGWMDQTVWDVFVDRESATQHIDAGYADIDLPFWGDDGISHPRLFAVTDWPTPVREIDCHITSLVVDASITVLDHNGQLRTITVDPDASYDELRAIRGKHDWTTYWSHRRFGRPTNIRRRAGRRPAWA